MSNTDKHAQGAGGRRQAERAPGRSVRMRLIGGGVLFAAAFGVLLPAAAAGAARAGVEALILAREMSWENGRITVSNESLLVVIDEMNRRSERKLILEDRSHPLWRKTLITGQFRTGRPEVLVEYIQAAGIKVRVRKDEGNIYLRLLPETRS